MVVLRNQFLENVSEEAWEEQPRSPDLPGGLMSRVVMLSTLRWSSVTQSPAPATAQGS